MLAGLAGSATGLAAPPPSGRRASAGGTAGQLPRIGRRLLARARSAGPSRRNIDWPNSGTRCEGEPKDKPPGVRLSFQRVPGGSPDLLFVFGITGVREGQPARAAGVNLTVIVQGTSRIYRHARRLALHRGLADAAAA